MQFRLLACILILSVTSSIRSAAHADEKGPVPTDRGDQEVAAYFEHETRKLADACLTNLNSWDEWTSQRETYGQQLREMLGLDPLPERTPLQPVVTGRLDHEEFAVELLHYQSRPRLYVTANLYLPKNQASPAPAILYVCGHSGAKKDGVSYGNKTKYQHHGAWFARNGYVCLVIDTLQLGEIEGIHHGTYREGMWWWNARGYTPAGVETWNSMRALDYLESRPEVDKDRIGVTGRSGGGAYSWYLAALDDRIKCLVPVAGITNLKNHIVDGCVEGHCDCMYTVNTHRWDYPLLAALAAPRPLLIANTDQDRIFPLDGVLDVHDKVRRLYELSGKRNNLGLHISDGPHEDTQVLQLHAMRWFNHHLKGDDSPVLDFAKPYFEPDQLKVFDTLPADQINTTIHESFVPLAAEPSVPQSADEWHTQRAAWIKALREKTFAGWPRDEHESAEVAPSEITRARSGDLQLTVYEFESEENVRLRLYVLHAAGESPEGLQSAIVRPLRESGWSKFLPAIRAGFGDQLKDGPKSTPDRDAFASLEQEVADKGPLVYFTPRGIGVTAWNSDPTEQLHIRRRFILLGQTLDGMRVRDLNCAIEALREIMHRKGIRIHIEADREMAGIALYAALFDENLDSLTLHDLAPSHRIDPDFLNVLRVLDVPQTVAMVIEKTSVRLVTDDEEAWNYSRSVARLLGRENEFEVVPLHTTE